MIGTQLGAYTVLKQIGEGGMGSVWVAEHAMLGRRAAIKVLHPTYSSRQDIVARFFNEAKAVTAISDPGIVQVFDFGHAADGSAYIVMELLDGEPLNQRLERLGVMPIQDALRIMRQVATSLGAAHARGIVHRDLKPENIFLVRDAEVAGGERAKILDFGIAKLSNESTVKTNTAVMMGTPTYMSPEQCRGAGQVDARADVYSLGCVLFQLVTGRPPFEAEGVGEIIAMHLREPAPAPSTRVATIPPELDHLVLSCLAKDPAQRFASAAALAGALGAMLGLASRPEGTLLDDGERRSAGIAATHISSAPSASSLPVTRAPAMSTPPPAPRRRTLLATVGIGAVCLGGVGIWLAVRGQGAVEPAVPSAAAAAAPPPTPTPTPPPVVVPPPDPRSELAAAMTLLFAHFNTWSITHARAGCPDAAALGGPGDPWGHPFAITCTQQPGDQVIGATSAGPDGTLDTGDDVHSWQLDNAVTATVRGPHWTVATPAVKATPHPARPTPPTIAPVTPPPTLPVATPTPIPTPTPTPPAVELDANGVPIHR